MEILDEELAQELGIELEVQDPIIPRSNLPQRVIQKEEMPQVVSILINKLKHMTINTVPLIMKTFHNDTIIIDPKLNIEIINKALGLNEATIFDFIYNIYFYGQDSILEEAFGKYIFISVPSLIFTQTGDNRFQFDF